MKDHAADGALVLLPEALQIAQHERGKERAGGRARGRRRQLEFLHRQLWESFKCSSLCAPPPKPPPLVP